MSNPMKYIKDLEAAGFQRAQAEAQVQVVLDAIEGDLVTKNDFAVFQERYEGRFAQLQERMTTQYNQFETRMQNQFNQFEARMENRFVQFEEKVEDRLQKSEEKIENRLTQQQQYFDYQMQLRIRESEFRITTRLGLLMVSSLSIAVFTLTWLIKF